LHSNTFIKDCEDYWNLAYETCELILSALCIGGLNVDKKLVLNLLRKSNSKENESCLRFMKYGSYKDEMLHQDISFLSVIPRTSNHGLQIISRGEQKNINVEEISPKHHLIIFPGQSLERLTAGYYAATPHRVSSKNGRISIPFQLRGNSECVLDTVSLNCSKIDLSKVNPGFQISIKYDDFIFQAYNYYKQDVTEPEKPETPSLFSKLFQKKTNYIGAEPLYVDTGRDDRNPFYDGSN